MQTSQAKCVKSAPGLTVGHIYQIERAIPMRYLIRNDAGFLFWYATENFEEVK